MLWSYAYCYFTSWHKIPCVTCPPIAMQMEVDFRGENDINLTEEEKRGI